MRPQESYKTSLSFLHTFFCSWVTYLFLCQKQPLIFHYKIKKIRGGGRGGEEKSLKKVKDSKSLKVVEKQTWSNMITGKNKMTIIVIIIMKCMTIAQLRALEKPILSSLWNTLYRASETTALGNFPWRITTSEHKKTRRRQVYDLKEDRIRMFESIAL